MEMHHITLALSSVLMMLVDEHRGLPQTTCSGCPVVPPVSLGVSCWHLADEHLSDSRTADVISAAGLAVHFSNTA